MAHSDDGQYELVLENKQVLGIFFVAALLCGVFFGLGFLVGRSSKGPTGTQPAGSSVSGASDTRRSAMPFEKPAAPDGSAPAGTPADSSAAADKPADAAPLAAAPAEREKPRAEEKLASPPPASAAPSSAASSAMAPPPAPAPAQAPASDKAIINLQVNVFSSPEAAEPVSSLLKRKNYPVSVVPGTTDHYYHVLVGPYPNMKEADIVKKLLEEEGFKPIVKK